jgi:hypothetical protein
MLPTEPRCAGNGTDLFVDGAPDADEEAVIAAACRRLATETEVFERETTPTTARRAEPSARPALRWLAGAWLVALLLCLPRRPGAWAWAAVGLAIRLAFPGPRVLMAVAYPYERMLVYAGAKPESALYGAGWPALMDLLRPISGADPDRLHFVDLALSTVTIAVAWEAARRATGDRGVARAAGFLVATLPLAVALARCEEAFVACALLAVAGVLGVARGDRLGALLAATSAGLLGNVRPDQLPLAAVLALALVARRRWLALLAIVPLALRVAAIEANPIHPSTDDLLRPLLHAVGRDAPTVVLDPWRTPFWLLPLAIIGFVAAGRRGWPRATLALAWLAGWAPYLVFERVTDLARFQLPSSTLLCLLAAMGVPAIRSRGRLARVALGVVVAAGLWVARRPLGGPMVQAVEHEVIRDDVCALPRGTVVRYDPAEDPHGGAARWVDVRCGVRLLPLRGPPKPGEYLLLGRGQRSPAGHPAPDCRLEPVVETSAPPYDGHVSDLGTEPVRIGLYRVAGCP